MNTSEELLLRACTGEVVPGSASDWQSVADLAQRHEVAPQIAVALRLASDSALSSGSQLGVPAHVQHTLSSLLELTLEEHRRSTSELIAVSQVLGDFDILVLKGPVLAERLYEKGSRSYHDLDLGVRASDYGAVRERLVANGYRPPSSVDERHQQSAARDASFQPPPGTEMSRSVEVHWQLGGPLPEMLDENGIWDRACTLMVDEYPVRTPSAMDTLLLLVLNLRQHRFRRLKTLCDIDRLLRIQGGSIDWLLLHRQAHDAGLCVALRHALHLAETALESPMPPLPPCHRRRTIQGWCLKQVATRETMLRTSTGVQSIVNGALPILSLDGAGRNGRLVISRLSSPRARSISLEPQANPVEGFE